MYAEPVTIEKDGDVFDIFFIDSEGLASSSDRSSRVNDTFTSDHAGER